MADIQTRPLRVSSLHVHPVKSCGGISIPSARLTARGLEHDREWMVVLTDGLFVTQRELPRLALIKASMGPQALNLECRGFPSLAVPLARSDQPLRKVTVWDYTGPALDEGDEAATWFSTVLGHSLRLVRWHPDQRRLSNLEWTGGREVENAFSDGYPILVLSEESLADLNRRIAGAPLPLNRFRPNIVIAGDEPYIEDHVRELRGEEISLRLVKACTRCSIAATNQETAEVGPEPLRTLATYRRNGRQGGVSLAQNAIILEGVGRELRVGMTFQATT
jgi:uncharacterized protein YcbX